MVRIELAGKSLTFSKGIEKLSTFAALFPESEGLSRHCFGNLKTYRQIIGWGSKPNTRKARQAAEKKGIPFLSLEDGFYRSLQPGVQGEPPLSLVVDDLGIYYDATRPSRLETMLQEGGWQSPKLLQRAELLIGKIRKYHISKYNHAPLLSRDLPGDNAIKILVVDQTLGDRSVVLGYADQTTFRQMLDDALEENPGADIMVKTHPDVIAGKKRGYFSEQSLSSPRIHLLAGDINPISLLEKVDKVYVVSSQLGFEALLCGKPVKCYGVPFYAGWGLTEDRQGAPRRTEKRSLQELFAAACILYPRYINPETGQVGEAEDLFAYLSRYSRLREKFPGSRIECRNFFWWKKRFIRRLFDPFGFQLSFSTSVAPVTAADSILVWGRRKAGIQEAQNNGHCVPAVIGMEDGFVRSVGLGSDYTLPLSLVLDQRGIYFDPQRPSDLEVILEQESFSVEDLRRADNLRQILLAGQISKYSVGKESPPQFAASRGQKIILVPGQVEDDASILRGCTDIRTNMALLQEARKACPDAFIVYKPHPDVVGGNRIGAIPAAQALTFCNEIVIDLSMPACLDACDEVHTLTSLTGFEALMRGKSVVTYGMPFYAGWGLTRDRHSCSRRTRRLTLIELICGTLIYYPVYLDPKTKQLIPVEQAIDILMDQKRSLPVQLAGGFWTKRFRKVRGLVQWNFC